MNKSKMEFRFMQISYHQYKGKVFQNLQKNLGTTENSSKFGTEPIKTNVLLWSLFLSSATKAAIHLGPNHTENLEVRKKANFEEIQSFFGITQKLILEHPEEILNVNTIDSTSPSWTRSTLSYDQKPKYVSTQTLFQAWRSCEIFHCPHLTQRIQNARTEH